VAAAAAKAGAMLGSGMARSGMAEIGVVVSPAASPRRRSIGGPAASLRMKEVGKAVPQGRASRGSNEKNIMGSVSRTNW
jgi:hypothetical protein